jgi:hypothetical protein
MKRQHRSRRNIELSIEPLDERVTLAVAGPHILGPFVPGAASYSGPFGPNTAILESRFERSAMRAGAHHAFRAHAVRLASSAAVGMRVIGPFVPGTPFAGSGPFGPNTMMLLGTTGFLSGGGTTPGITTSGGFRFDPAMAFANPFA